MFDWIKTLFIGDESEEYDIIQQPIYLTESCNDQIQGFNRRRNYSNDYMDKQIIKQSSILSKRKYDMKYTTLKSYKDNYELKK